MAVTSVYPGLRSKCGAQALGQFHYRGNPKFTQFSLTACRADSIRIQTEKEPSR